MATIPAELTESLGGGTPNGFVGVYLWSKSARRDQLFSVPHSKPGGPLEEAAIHSLVVEQDAVAFVSGHFVSANETSS